MKTRPNGNRKNKSNGQVKYSYLDLMFHLSGDSSCYGIGQPKMLIKFSLGNFTKKNIIRITLIHMKGGSTIFRTLGVSKNYSYTHLSNIEPKNSKNKTRLITYYSGLNNNFLKYLSFSKSKNKHIKCMEKKICIETKLIKSQ